MLNSSFAGRPGLCGPAATGITAARPGHDCDCAQAPVRLVACRAAGSRLVVSKIPRALDPVPVWLLAYPASDGWHSQFKWVRKLTARETRAMLWLITAMTRNVTRGTGVHPTWIRNGPLDPDKTRFIELRDVACTPLTYKLLHNLLSSSCTKLYNCSRPLRLYFN